MRYKPGSGTLRLMTAHFDPIYFDHNATTPVDSRVGEAMLPWLGSEHGNPSSTHGFGRRARQAVDLARQQVAELISVPADEVLFLASGTEANNSVIRGVAQRSGFVGHIVHSSLEHPSVHAMAQEARRLGMAISEVPPELDGRVSPERMAAALRPDTRLVCLMMAHNELGTLQPVVEVAEACRRRGVPLMCDVSQAVGKVPVSCATLDVDYLIFGGHKFHGPPGVAVLRIRAGADFRPLLLGGGQERKRRASTENVPGIVGLGRAAELARLELDDRRLLLGGLRDRLEDGLAEIDGVTVHCARSPRLPHTSHVGFEGVVGQRLAERLDAVGYAVSTGAACHKGEAQPSRVLLQMGFSAEQALSSLRISFGITNRLAEVEAFLPVLAAEVKALRQPVAV